MTEDQLDDDRMYVRTEFLREVKVIDRSRGYISVSSFNLRMKPSVLSAAARLIKHEFEQDTIDCIHGIPHSGNYLATAVALALGNGVRLHTSRKDQQVPTSWKDIYRAEIRSFTTSNSGLTVFSGLNLSFVKKGDRVLIIDDVCATGETGYHIVNGLLSCGVSVVGFAVLFDKLFQGGLARIAELGIKTYSCVRVRELTPTDVVHIGVRP